MITFNMTKMKTSHYWNFLTLWISLPIYLVNGQVDFVLEGTSCQSFDATLGCVIDTFASSASWKRGAGEDLVVTCSYDGPCSQISQTMNGNKYSFFGNSSGIYMSTNLKASEHEISWTCTYHSNDYIYAFNLGCEQVDFILEGTSCQSFDATLGCVIDTFASSASWKRGAGEDLVVTCSFDGQCSQISQTINGNQYSFFGNSSGIYMSTKLNASEHGISWNCTYKGNDYNYIFNLSCDPTATNEKSTEETTQTEIVSENTFNPTVDSTVTNEMSTEETTQTEIVSENTSNLTVDPTVKKEMSTEDTSQTEIVSENTFNLTVGPTSEMTTIVITDRMTSVHITESQQNCTDEDNLRCNTDNHTSSSTISFIKNETTNHFANTNSAETSIKSVLSEKNKSIIFISAISVVLIIIVFILLMVFACMYMSKVKSKKPNEDDTISWGSCSIPNKTAHQDNSIYGKRIYPLLNISSTSFKCPYEHNWNGVV